MRGVPGDDAAAPASARQPSPRRQLLADLAQRQPLLVAINLAAASLFAIGAAGSAPAAVLEAWFGSLALVQVARLACWRRHAAGRGPSRDPASWLVATSAASGVGWGAIALLSANPESLAHQVLVPFFLGGMAAGAVATLAAHPPALAAFLAPALLPYAARLALAGEPVQLTMALTTVAYAAGLSAVAHQVHGSMRRSVVLHLENASLVGDLEQARKRLEELAERRGAELETVLEAVPVAVWLTRDLEAKRITSNRRAAEMLRLGHADNALLTAPAVEQPTHFKFTRDDDAVSPEHLPLQRAARGETVRGEELRVVFEDGSFFDELISAAPVRDASGSVVGAVAAAMDITDRKRAEEEIRRLALHDPLTGLPNRLLLLDRLGQALASARRDRRSVAITLLDLDHFKEVNDALGHAAGDALLRAVAGRIGAAIRASDTLARFGGDEFALVQPGVLRPAEAADMAEKILAALKPPFDLEGHEIHVTASLGVVLHAPAADDIGADELIGRADLALYRAKQHPGGAYRFFAPAMEMAVRMRRRLDRELRRALDGGEFLLHYQPQFDLATGRTGGVEALVRWRHPERGLVAPGDFIPAAEASGLIHPLGAWVLGEACRQARAWQDEGLALIMAVNLSPAQLRHEGVLQVVDHALKRHGLDGRWLELEITEGLLVEQNEGATAGALRGLAARGVRLALDDFGTGYSNLAYLKRLPVQRIKLDRSFVSDIGRDPDDEAVVRAVVTLGRTLGKEVLAEGVETEAQLAFLRRLGCDAAQGFLLARPSDAAGLRSLLTA